MPGLKAKGAAAAAAAAWTVEWDCTDASALSSNDFKSSSPATVNGVSMTLANAGGVSRMELDGSTGLVIESDASEFGWHYNGTFGSSTNAGGQLQFDIADAIPDWDPTTDTIAFQVRTSSDNFDAAWEGLTALVGQSTAPDAGEFVRVGAQGTQAVIGAKGTADDLTGSSAPDFFEIIVAPYGNVTARAGDWPGSWAAPGSWTSTIDSPIDYHTDQPTYPATERYTAASAIFAIAANARYNTSLIDVTVAGWRVLRVTGSADNSSESPADGAQLIAEIDFANVGDVDLQAAGDQTTTLDGVSVQTKNMSNAAQFEVLSGVLVVSPNTSTENSGSARTAPALVVPLSAVWQSDWYLASDFFITAEIAGGDPGTATDSYMDLMIANDASISVAIVRAGVRWHGGASNDTVLGKRLSSGSDLDSTSTSTTTPAWLGILPNRVSASCFAGTGDVATAPASGDYVTHTDSFGIDSNSDNYFYPADSGSSVSATIEVASGTSSWTTALSISRIRVWQKVP